MNQESFGFIEETAFHLQEEDIRRYLIEHIKELQPDFTFVAKELGVLDDGRLDVLVSDAKEDFHVIEIKAEKADLTTLDQILRYMEALTKIYWNKQINGLILAPKFSDELLDAVGRITTVSLVKINIHCRLDFNPV